MNKQLLLISALSLIWTTGAAQTWSPQVSGVIQDLTGVSFASSAVGWAVGTGGTTLHTTDGGANWSTVSLTGEDLESVRFRDESTGIIMGDNGLILSTITAGMTWSVATSATGVNLRTGAFGDNDMAYAAGVDGVIIRSTDAGQAWELRESGTVRYRGSAARGASKAWIVGDGGVIKATTDAGLSWFDQPSGTASDLHGVFFINESEGWAGGQNNTVLYTSDGGASWTPRNSGIQFEIEALHFVSTNEGWCVGHAGAVYHTTDGGVTWVLEGTGVAGELNDVVFQEGTGWAVGNGGVILTRSISTGVSGVAGLPDAVQLRQNYPNPFNPSTSIAYTIAEGGFVTLRVHDLTGRAVATLVSGRQGPGTHSVDFTAAGLSSGLYVYRLTTGGRSVSRTMMLLK